MSVFPVSSTQARSLLFLYSHCSWVRWHLRWHSGVGGTLPLTETTVTTNSASGGQLSGASTRVHGDGLADDEAICDKLADGLAGVGVRDLVDLIWVEPDLALAAVGDAGGQALLGTEVDPTGAIVLVILSWV